MIWATVHSRSCFCWLYRAPPSLGFSRQEYWSGLPFLPPVHESEKWKWSHSVVSDSERPHGPAAYQAPPSMGFSRQEYWNGVGAIQFSLNLGNKEFMIWARISSQFCFCRLCRASPSLAAKNIISLILVLTIWWCPCVDLLLCCRKRECYDQCVLVTKLC